MPIFSLCFRVGVGAEARGAAKQMLEELEVKVEEAREKAVVDHKAERNAMAAKEGKKKGREETKRGGKRTKKVESESEEEAEEEVDEDEEEEEEDEADVNEDDQGPPCSRSGSSEC